MVESQLTQTFTGRKSEQRIGWLNVAPSEGYTGISLVLATLGTGGATITSGPGESYTAQGFKDVMGANIPITNGLAQSRLYVPKGARDRARLVANGDGLDPESSIVHPVWMDTESLIQSLKDELDQLGLSGRYPAVYYTLNYMIMKGLGLCEDLLVADPNMQKTTRSQLELAEELGLKLAILTGKINDTDQELSKTRPRSLARVLKSISTFLTQATQETQAFATNAVLGYIEVPEFPSMTDQDQVLSDLGHGNTAPASHLLTTMATRAQNSRDMVENLVSGLDCLARAEEKVGNPKKSRKK